MDDNAIVELFLERDERAIAEAEAKYGARLRQIAGRLCGIESAKECVNDALLAAWQSIPPNEPRDYLFNFLARIARGLAINRMKAERAGKRSAELVELTREMEACIPAGASPDKVIEAEELSRAVSRFLLARPKEQRVIFVRRYWYAESYPEIAARLGCGAGRVRTILYRLRRKLREYLESEGLFDERN